MRLSGFNVMRFAPARILGMTKRKLSSCRGRGPCDEQKDYAATKRKIIEAIMPMRFILLGDFHKRTLLPGEPHSVYVHQLKQLLNQAMPDLAAPAKEQLLLHQFLAGLPEDISKQLRTTGITNTH